MRLTNGIVIALFIIAAVLIGWSVWGPSKLDAFAGCLGERGATFYGAYWCPHCGDQKALFGRAKQKLPYVECSLPNRGGQNEVCNAAGIESYPTWELADGSRVSGVVTLKELSERTGCELPS